MLKRILVVALLAFFFVLPAGEVMAQEGVITGTVIDSTTSESIPGVNVVVDELGAGAATDAEGQFEIPGVPVGSHTLTVSFVGYATKSVPVEVEAGETTNVEIQLAPRAVELEDVVVTALGIEREERSLGYAVQRVEGEDLARVPEPNFIGNLQGKVSGATISTSNAMGGSARIVLRGVRSIAGDNQPLIVVDGTPLDNSNFTNVTQARGAGGYDYGNAASMINPSDVQDVSVLKGPTAAALYGSRAANGVIEITTRSGQGLEGIGVTVNTGVTMRSVYGLPEYQNTYGGGSWRPFSENDQGQLVADFGTDQSWGPRLDGRDVRQWYSYDDVNGLEGEATPWVAHPDNVQNFFESGAEYNTSVAFAQGGDDFNYRLSLNNITTDDVFPNGTQQRNQLGFNGSLDLTDRLTTTLRANYVKQGTKGRAGTGYDGRNVFQQFNHFGQRHLDLGPDSYMTDYERPDGSQRGWNWHPDSDPATESRLIYFNNPYWVRYNNFQEDSMDRIYGNVGVSYDLTDAVTLSANARTDFYTERRHERFAVGSTEQPAYLEEIRQVQESNFSAQAEYTGQLTEEFSLDAVLGTEYRYNSFDENSGNTAGGLSVPEVYTLENSVSRPSIVDYFEERGLLGVYGSAVLGYQDIVYLEGSLRNDWSSTLPEGENSYLYPSAKMSLVFSELGPMQDVGTLSFGRLRLGWSQVGNDTDPYQLRQTYDLDLPFRGNPVQSIPDQLNNAELKPEITTSVEAGIEVRFFSNRLALDAAVYSDESRNQILGVAVSQASGYEQLLLNAGEISSQGVELSLTGTPVLTEQAEWSLTANWSRNVSEVVELDDELGLTSYTIGAPLPFGPDVVARVGERYGTLFGSGYVYDDDGNIVLGSSGLPQLSDPKPLGSYLPDWTAGLSSTFSYGNVSASVVLNGQKGGRIYSVTNMFGMYSGIIEETVEGNVRELGVIPEGVTADGEEWTGRLDPNFFFLNGFFGNNEANTFDASYIKLQEVSIGYTLPGRWFGESPVQGLTVTAIGRNLATLFKKTPHFDPATAISATNLQGVEAGQIPPQRSYGISLNLRL